MNELLPTSEIRDLLCQVQGIRAVEVHQGVAGAIEELRIAVDSGVPEKRVVRDVESALMSALGVGIDHRTIVVEPRSNGETSPGRSAAGKRNTPKWLTAHFLRDITPFRGRIRLRDVRCDPDGELYCDVTVTLEVEGGTIARTVREADTERGRVLAAARAAIQGISDLLHQDIAIVLEDIDQFSIGETMALVALVRIRRGRARKLFHGATSVNSDLPDAAARVILDALNRFLATGERNDEHSREDTHKGGRFLTA